MILVEIFRNKAGEPTGFRCTGHAGYAPAGQDIVCSAVTAMALAAITGMTDLLQLEPEYVADVEGDIQCYLDPAVSLTKQQREGVTLLIRTFELGCQQIADSYEETYIQIKRHNLEVQDNVEG